MNNRQRPSTPGLEMQLFRVQRHETKIKQKTYSPIMCENKIVALAKFVREDSEQIDRNHPVFKELSAAAAENSLPFFLIQNDADYDCFTVTPGNARARQHVFCKVEMNIAELEQLFDHCNTYQF